MTFIELKLSHVTIRSFLLEKAILDTLEEQCNVYFSCKLSVSKNLTY